jgi:hypothetical protein
MEQEPLCRFSTLKKLKTRVIHTELEPVYDPEVLARPTMKK